MAALAEAAYLIGLERNADVVKKASYAPLFFNGNDIAWPVNMIAFDSSRVMGRSSYHVQKLFSWNRPDEVLQTQVVPAVDPDKREVYALAGLDKKTGDLIIKAVNRAGSPRTLTIKVGGIEKLGKKAKVTILSHDDALNRARKSQMCGRWAWHCSISRFRSMNHPRTPSCIGS